MPKKGQASRGGGGGKPKPAPTPATSNADDSFIVFSNAKDKPKNTTPGQVAPKEKAVANGVNENGPNAPDEAPKRPDTRKLIGGASWTGKLPVNMLLEHCQKQKWEKPEYTMVDHL